jgi:uncharacterized membrane protein
MGSHRPRDRRDAFLAAPPPRRRVSANTLIVAGGLLLAAAVVFTTRSQPLAAPAAAFGPGRDVALPVADFADGQARFYAYTSAAGATVRFFVMRSSDGVIRAAFDTCDVCFRERRGYRQDGDSMVCNNCGQAFASRNINVLQGGCNPAPVDRAVEGGQVVVRAAALERGVSYFAEP